MQLQIERPVGWKRGIGQRRERPAFVVEPWPPSNLSAASFSFRAQNVSPRDLSPALGAIAPPSIFRLGETWVEFPTIIKIQRSNCL